MYSEKELAGLVVIFLENWVAGSGARNRRQELEGSALAFLGRGVSKLTSVIVQYHQKASVKIQHFGRENSNHTLARCAFFYQHY